ncbi:hypothetical protein [Xylella fastidiosa]|uniref:Uncharacterized protein n=2 Tax=Xylella fastidiosa TaxID=2371 RepID=A0ABD7BYK0_XYLFS|nr:hypothetical protein [Xylella fastidiosa]AAF84412.1 hypothetical protein XF_1603 [Xylella fastidiosa 9a5c]MDG5822871.1 hypothetical protein [Xylella fastidiosa subsp. pauca]QPB72565.1 hypothetical protein XFHB_13715 [Xylella fastidiosa]QPB72570.1 hypothetical protein XFHB_13735 [Xylella fastidiosa]WGZ31178.1 hypothetical protein O4444_06480 [Xylella fastidiosa subsp. pauca]
MSRYVSATWRTDARGSLSTASACNIMGMDDSLLSLPLDVGILAPLESGHESTL